MLIGSLKRHTFAFITLENHKIHNEKVNLPLQMRIDLQYICLYKVVQQMLSALLKMDTEKKRLKDRKCDR